MTKDEFIKKAKGFGYVDEDIEEMIDLVEEANEEGIHMTYDYVSENVLTEQPVY